MMQCTACGVELASTDPFCPSCGAAPGGRGPGRQRGELVETVLWSGTFSAKGLIHSWLLAVLITVVMPAGGLYVQSSRVAWIVIGAILGAVWLGLLLLLSIQKLNVHYELTNQRLIHRSGILLRRSNRIELIDVDDVSHEQGLIERFFDVGKIVIHSSDRSHPIIELPGIEKVEQIASLIDDARRRERMRRGIYVEQI